MDIWRPRTDDGLRTLLDPIFAVICSERMMSPMTHFNKMSRRDVLKSAAAAALGVAALPVVGDPLSASAFTRNNATTQLKYATPANAPEIPIFKGLANQFNKTHGNAQAALQLVAGTWENFDQKLTAELAANAAPDVIRDAIIYRPLLITNWVRRGYDAVCAENALL